MDKRLQKVAGWNEPTSIEQCEYEGGVIAGFEFAIQRLRENAYYGHYAQFLADWLEKHLNEEVTSDKAK